MLPRCVCAACWMPQGMERIQMLLQAGADPNAKDALGETVLHKVRMAVGDCLLLAVQRTHRGDGAAKGEEGSEGTMWGALCSGNTCPIPERMALHFYSLALQAARCKGRQQRGF